MDQIAEILSHLLAASAEPLTRRQHLLKRTTDTYWIHRTLSRTWYRVDKSLQVILNRLAAGEVPWPFYLYGSVGGGKTRAVFAFCDALERARYWMVGQVMDLMIAKKAPWAENGRPALAVLDELGTHKARDFEYDAVKAFLDWREDRPAIYISNHPPGQMRRAYDERIESRLTCGTVFHLQGPDRRKETAP